MWRWAAWYGVRVSLLVRLKTVISSQRYERVLYLNEEMQVMLVDVESFGRGRAGQWWILTFNLLIKFVEKLDAAHTKPTNIRIVRGLAKTLDKTGNLACHKNWDRFLISFSSWSSIKCNCFLALQGSQKRLALCSSTYLSSSMDLCHLVDSKFGCDAAVVLRIFV